MDVHVSRAAEQVERVLAASERAPTVASFFDEKTFTASYVVHDPVTRRAAIVDSVMDFDHAAGRIAVVAEGLTVDWILETHAHAYHLSAAPYLQQRLGGKLAIGAEIVVVQEVFGKIFNEGTEFVRDGSSSTACCRTVTSSG